MIGTNVTFFAMILLGYGGMPRRYATYLPEFATLHQVATLGAIFITVGQLVWLFNMVQSYVEGRRIEDGDPWNLADDGLKTAEWEWLERRRATAVADGGEDRDDAA
jgi:cytochrome c oxidase subunit 1